MLRSHTVYNLRFGLKSAQTVSHECFPHHFRLFSSITGSESVVLKILKSCEAGHEGMSMSSPDGYSI